MTSVASTSYYASLSYRANTAPSNRAPESVYDALYSNQQRETKPEAKVAVDASGSGVPIDTTPSTATTGFQGKLFGISSINIGSEVPLAKPVWELPEDQYRDYLETQRSFLEMDERVLAQQHTRYPDLSNDPRLKPYAEIVVKGKVVATIDNQGIAVSKDPAWSERYRDVMGSLNGTVGPDLAERTAKAIAKALGGRVVKQETAMDQLSFERFQSPDPWIDYDAMKDDKAYAELQERRFDLQKLETRRAQYLSEVA